MERLDQSVIDAIVSGPEFTTECTPGHHTTFCEILQQLRDNNSLWSCMGKSQGMSPIEFFGFGFLLAREYYAIKRLEETVVTTVKP